MEVSNRVDRVGVHTHHCCRKCGRKYGDSYCPVVLGISEAECLCEWYEERKEDLRKEFLRMDLPELQETILRVKKLIRGRES